jgi:hypothetical protein
VENTGSESFNFAIQPKVTLLAGVSGDDITYDDVSRGYANYTLFAGGSWQILPSMSINARGGGSYTEPATGQGMLSPYAALAFNWTLGARSSLSFNYSHEVVPNDDTNSNGELADRINATFTYDATTYLTTFLQATYTNSTTSGSLIASGSDISSYSEQDYGLTIGGAYHYDKYIDLDFGFSLSGVESGQNERDYDRQEIYLGVRGTY